MPTKKLARSLFVLAGTLFPVSAGVYLATGIRDILIWGMAAALAVAITGALFLQRALVPLAKGAGGIRSGEGRAPEEYLLSSIQAWDRKEYGPSLQYAQSGLSLNPQNPRTKSALFHRLGLVRQHYKEYPKAVTAFETAAQLDPGFSAPHNNLGIIHYERKDYAVAEAEFKKAIALDPKFAWPHNNLGNHYFAQKRFAEAEKEYKEALRLDPAYPDAKHNLEKLQKAMGKTE
ncbi:MAG: tetratricopeptide repeat protein [Nitrospinae bacterium]|nr:tetratricopeptide repeat protein [Nitrospinota bacterium]